MEKPKIDELKLTPEQRDKLELWQQSKDQLQALQDIADMTQELVTIMDDQNKTGSKNIKDVGVLLVDIRESLASLNGKESPPVPDFAKPVIGALTSLEKTLGMAIKSINVKPEVRVDAPQVNVSPPSVDLKGVEKLLKTEIPKAFKESIGLIPRTEIPETDFGPLLEAWKEISEQLESLETATRMKPLPGSINVPGVATEATLAKTVAFDANDGLTYDWTNPNAITITDGVKTQTITISGTTATETWG